MIDVSDLIGVRFVNHGRSVAQGFDCYGLAIEVSKRNGHSLPDLWYVKSTDEVFSNNAERIIKSLSNVIEVTDLEEEGNLVVFFENGRMVHIGCIIEEDIFIHCDKFGVRIQKLSEYHRKNWRLYKWL